MTTARPLAGARYLLFVDDVYEDLELWYPKLRLIEAGRLTAETPLSAAIPEFGADRDDVVRLRHLAPVSMPGLMCPPSN